MKKAYVEKEGLAAIGTWYVENDDGVFTRYSIPRSYRGSIQESQVRISTWDLNRNFEEAIVLEEWEKKWKPGRIVRSYAFSMVGFRDWLRVIELLPSGYVKALDLERGDFIYFHANSDKGRSASFYIKPPGKKKYDIYRQAQCTRLV